jgi:hypothetical protein
MPAHHLKGIKSMTKYNVHINREVRLVFESIEADSHEAAAAVACDKHPAAADDIDDCDGETFSAQVDVAGDEDSSQFVTIDFESERIRKSAPKLLVSLEALLPYAENEAYSLDKLKDSPEAEAEAERAWKAVEAAQAAIAQAKAAGILPAAADIDIHALLAQRRQIAAIWSIEDVQGIRPDLSEDRCWEVLQNVDRHQDAELGITWLTLEMAAEHLYGDAPETDKAAEA